MIAKTLIQIVDELNAHLNSLPVYSTSPNQAKIIHLTKDTTSLPKIAVTLINVEEDKVYKNHIKAYDKVNGATSADPIGGQLAMRVNLYVLFSFKSSTSDGENYVDSLTRLAHLLRYFQGKKYQDIRVPVPGEPDLEFTVQFNYHNINLEDSNNMWSNLGGEQRPYAMYQIKMLELEPHIEPTPVATIQHQPNISSPDFDPDGNVIFDPATGATIGDTNKITHIK